MRRPKATERSWLSAAIATVAVAVAGLGVNCAVTAASSPPVPAFSTRPMPAADLVSTLPPLPSPSAAASSSPVSAAPTPAPPPAAEH